MVEDEIEWMSGLRMGDRLSNKLEYTGLNLSVIGVGFVFSPQLSTQRTVGR